MEKKKSTESTIVKFYNYFMKSPKFKRAERFSWVQEPFIAFPFVFLILMFVVCSFGLVLSLKGLNIGDEKYIGLTFVLMNAGVAFLSLIISMIKLLFVDNVTSIGSYNDVIKLKNKLEFLLKTILCKRVDNDDKFHFVTIDYKCLINEIAAVLFTSKIYTSYLRDFLEITYLKEDVPKLFDKYFWDFEDYVEFVTAIIINDFKFLDECSFHDSFHNVDYESTQAKIIRDYCRLAGDIPELKEDVIENFVDYQVSKNGITDYTKVKDIIDWKQEPLILSNESLFLRDAGISDKDIEKYLKTKRKCKAKELITKKIDWI